MKKYSGKELEIYEEGYNDGCQALVPRGTYQCFHCCSYGVIWGSDFSFEDFGYDGEGIVHCCTCANCGAEIEYRIPLDDPEDEEE